MESILGETWPLILSDGVSTLGASEEVLDFEVDRDEERLVLILVAESEGELERLFGTSSR